MKLVKSLLLGSAAGLAAVAGAQAADLPSKKAAPVEYVRVCSAHGAGFFYIPGSDTCIKIGGRVRFDYGYGQTYNRRDNKTGMGALGRFELDARNSTEFGLLRAFTRVDFMRLTGGGSIRSGSGPRVGTTFGGTAYGYTTADVQTVVNLSRAFVQLGGMTAGRSVSFFGFYNGDYEMVGTTAADGRTTQLLAYTATFGQGFSATLSLEDPIERRNALAYAGGNFVSPITGAGTGTSAAYYAYGGAAMPEIVAALRVDQSWGSAQLSGAVHQILTAGGGGSGTAGTSNGTVISTATGNPGFGGDAAYGWALNAGVKFNLPMIAAGDALFLQATYTQGASSYIASNALGVGSGTSYAIGKLTMMMPDAVITGSAANPGLSLVTVWGLTAAAQHYWTPKIRQALFASYVASDIPAGAYEAAGGRATVTNNLRNASYWTVGSNVIWTPIKGLDIGAELNYLQLNSDQGSVNSNQAKVNAVGGLIGESSAIVGRIRVDRTF